MPLVQGGERPQRLQTLGARLADPDQDPARERDPQLAGELVRLRDNWLNPPGASDAELKKRTLTNLYNQRPTWLDLAHRRLDQAVLDAYGWPHDLAEEQILERLLALNLERSAGPTVSGGNDRRAEGAGAADEG